MTAFDWRVVAVAPGGARGHLLCLDGVPLRALHNRAGEPAVLVAVSRRR